MRNSFLGFSPPLIGEEEIAEVVDCLRSDWITTGPKTKQFEQDFAAFLGAPAALAVSSGTDAMLVGLAAMGIGPGDEVITTTMTFCSTVHVIEQVGAKPVLVDVEPDTLNIDPLKVEKAINGKTRAILPVHLYGHACDMDALCELASAKKLRILEDAAHALPALYKGRMVGTMGDGTAFSFYATKNLTTGEGGMLTGSPDLIKDARLWSLHGLSGDAYRRYSQGGAWGYQVVLPGFKCNMSDIQSSIGLQQLKKLNRFQEIRHRVVDRYRASLADCAEVQLPTERPGIVSAWNLFALRLNLDMLSIDRDRFIEELRNRNIGCSVHFIPVHVHPYYRDRYGYQPKDFEIAFNEYLRIVTLPLNLRMTDADIDDVVEAVREICAKFRR
jgi:dTDP-4-amino-4,6-dideoxygalactose transaminase